MAYLDTDGVRYLWSKIKGVFASKGDAVSNITRSGTTFTATKADGTSFTFTQQDNSVAKSTTTPLANGDATAGAETAYAAGDHVHPLQRNIPGNAATADRLRAPVSVDGVMFDGSVPVSHYGTCSTSAGTTAKTVECEGFSIGTGAWVAVRFTVTNTGPVENLTLNVNSTGAKSIRYRGGNVPSAGTLEAGRTYLFVYDGVSYELVGDLMSVVASSTAPAMDGTASVGSSSAYARADHVHPTDTSRASASDLTTHANNTSVHITSEEREYWNSLADADGTVKMVDTGVGLTGGPITSSGTVGLDLKSSTAHSHSSATPTNVAGRQYPVGVDADGHLSVNVPWLDTSSAEGLTGVLDIAHGGTGTDTLGTGIVYHGASDSSLTVATAANVAAALGSTAVQRATADAAGNNIADTYAKKSDIAAMYKYKGSVANEAALPSSGQSVGDVYNIETRSSYGSSGANVAWNGTEWDSLGEVFTIAAISNAEIDLIVEA